MPTVRLGVALLLPPAVAAEVDGLRRALGDPSLGRIPAHLTLVPPVNVQVPRILEALARLRAAAGATRSFSLELGPPATFLPDNPVLYLAVSHEGSPLAGLRDRVFTPPLARTLTWPWVPHVTVADGADPARIAAAVVALADYRATITVDRVHLLQEGPGRVWEPIADAGFARLAVVGRGGLALELATSDRLDPEAAAWLELTAPAGPHRPGRPFALTARRDGRLVGVATGTTRPDEATLDDLVVEPAEHGQGIGAHVLAAVESLAAERGCRRVEAVAPTGSRGAAFLAGRGWRTVSGPDDTVRVRLYRALGSSGGAGVRGE